MEYTSKLFVDFLEKIIAFDKRSQSAIDDASRVKKDRDAEEKNEWGRVRIAAEQQAKAYSNKVQTIFKDFHEQMDSVLFHDVNEKASDFAKLQKCKEALVLIHSAENSITQRDVYNANQSASSKKTSISVEDILQGKIDFISMAYALNEALKSSKGKAIADSSASFYNTCRAAESILTQEITDLRKSIVQNSDSLHRNYADLANSSHQKSLSEWNLAMSTVASTAGKYLQQRKASLAETEKVCAERDEVLRRYLGKLTDEFCMQFPPQEFAGEYIRLYSLEPSYDEYSCYKEMPRNVHIGTMEYDISTLNLSIGVQGATSGIKKQVV